MNRLAYFAASVAILGGLLMPLSASALGLSFGGVRIVSINYCKNGGINIIIVPAGLFPISYIYTPGTIGLPPTHIGQAILGLYLPVLYACTGFGTRPPIFTGFWIQLDAVSP
ncbi:MAG: hypothetical protein Q7S26_02870 [bacterium]|nr:hypothetical protein [bacterium]